MDNIERLLINVLILIIFLLFIPLLIESHQKGLTEEKKKWVMIIFASLGSITSMLFPIQLDPNFIFDLRWISVIIGSLYTGMLGSIILSFITVLIRFIVVGVDLGAFTTLTNATIILAAFIIIHKLNVLDRKKSRILIGTAFTLSATIINISIHLILGVAFSISFIYIFILIYLGTYLMFSYILELNKEVFHVYRRLVKLEKMEVVGQLAASISHEVRNPLTVVKGFLQLSSKRDLPSDIKNYLDLSIKEIDRANEIIVNYLTFAKPAPDKFVILNIKQELHQVINIISPLANMNNVEIVLQGDTYFIKGQSNLFQQCLLNICKNCIEAMPNSGVLRIETKYTSRKAVIEIADNGKGMTEEQISRIGEPYFTTKGREGTGLGMFTVFSIVEVLNGDIKVDSQINEGTKFKLAFIAYDGS